ncbi:hypothetical protein PC9H_004097 [Pleurotus ostreatus]|uniref:Uncharacterized protein n=1 Tax=Pleurotus ostreatus TaxID=5322 RepID=A0A8H6ZZM2_PLEOS|nr:uncharacterized protein PC9H_004097 [Pleurotus ostreatus]KAF7437260.1 hypothetical protein PC9H_004097 [Pleurotus ostreatus]
MSGRLAILIKPAYVPPHQVRIVARGDQFSQAEADDSWEPAKYLTTKPRPIILLWKVSTLVLTILAL